MVVSRIETDVSYPELKKVDPSDLKMESNLYQIDAIGVPIIIAVGNANHDKEDENLTTFPIYLVKKNNKVTRIGVYEISASNISSYVDDDGKLKVEKMDDPLLFSFVDKQMLGSLRREPEKEEIVTSEDIFATKTPIETIVYNEINLPEDLQQYFIVTAGVQQPKPLKTETKKDAKDIREKYHAVSTDLWIQKMMQNRNYGIIDNEGCGDCFFATIRDSFSQIGLQISVSKLRDIFASEVTNDFFLGYKEKYDMYDNSLKKDSYEIKQLQEKYDKLKKEYDTTLDRLKRKQISEQAIEIKHKNDQLVKENKVTRTLLKEVAFMKNIDSLEKFRQVIKKTDFWADTATMSTLERVLRIKFIVMSQEHFSAKDVNNVLQCGQLNDTILQDKGVFNPLYYIMVDYNGTHYKLITYKKRNIFTFSEIPYDIKKMVVDKCMEKNAGCFSLIPEFVTFKKNLLSNDKIRSVKEKKDEEVLQRLSDANIKGLYDENILFVFYSKSYAKPLPGKGSGEKIPETLRKSFAPLALVPNWRRKLAYEWVQPFSLDDHKWASVETYYQAQKFKKENPEFYLLFTMDSTSNENIANDPEIAKAAGSPTGKYKGQILRPKEIKIDPDFYGKRSEKALYDGLYAKFSQNEDLKELLLNTQNAKLVQYLKSRKGEVCNDLMVVRDKLANP